MSAPDPTTGSLERATCFGVITGAGSAFPGVELQSRLWDEFFAAHFSHSRVAHAVFASAGVRTRHAAANPCNEDVSRWGTGARMQRFSLEALPLAKSAVVDALTAASLVGTEVGQLAVVSCTGYATPGVDIALSRELGLADGMQRLFFGHMGCHAALPALGVAHDYVVTHRRPAILLCVELASLHLQPPSDDLEQFVAHALFSDAAAAIVVEPAEELPPGGLAIIDVAARTDTATAQHMSWAVTDLGFRMGLSRAIPELLARLVRPLVDELLSRNGLARAAVDFWALHPGGPRVLETVADELGLDESALAASRTVLSEHGNCSSATVLLVLDEIRRRQDLAAGQHVVALAFGPGLTLYGSLLRAG